MEMGAPFSKALKLSDKFNKTVSLVSLIEALKSSTLEWLQFRKGRRDLFLLHYNKLAVHPKKRSKPLRQRSPGARFLA